MRHRPTAHASSLTGAQYLLSPKPHIVVARTCSRNASRLQCIVGIFNSILVFLRSEARTSRRKLRRRAGRLLLPCRPGALYRVTAKREERRAISAWRKYHLRSYRHLLSRQYVMQSKRASQASCAALSSLPQSASAWRSCEGLKMRCEIAASIK